MSSRALSAFAAAALTAASVTACQEDGGTPRQPALWARTETTVYELATIGKALVGVRVNAKEHFELLAIDPDTGKVRHRRATEPPDDWKPKAGQIPIVAGGHAIAYNGSTLDVLDPVTFETRWSYSSPVAGIRECRPHVCVIDSKGVTHILDGDSGKELWTSKTDVFWVDTLLKIRYFDDYPNWTVRRVDTDSGSPKHGWKIHPTKSYFASRGFAFGALTDDTISIKPYDYKDSTLATDAYAARTGDRLWSRKKLDVRQMAGHYIGLEEDNRAVHFLDPKTGRDTWVAKAPSGHVFDADYPVAVDSKNAIWLGLHEFGNSKMRFAPVDAADHELGKLKPSKDTVVFSRAPDPRSVTVRVNGKAHDLEPPAGYRPVDASTGSPVTMPADLRVPNALTLGKDLLPVGKQYPYAIDKSGHAILG